MKLSAKCTYEASYFGPPFNNWRKIVWSAGHNPLGSPNSMIDLLRHF